LKTGNQEKVLTMTGGNGKYGEFEGKRKGRV
jgi:hypothetical protein